MLVDDFASEPQSVGSRPGRFWRWKFAKSRDDLKTLLCCVVHCTKTFISVQKERAILSQFWRGLLKAKNRRDDNA